MGWYLGIGGVKAVELVLPEPWEVYEEHTPLRGAYVASLSFVDLYYYHWSIGSIHVLVHQRSVAIHDFILHQAYNFCDASKCGGPSLRAVEDEDDDE